MIVNLDEIKKRLDPFEVLRLIGYPKSAPKTSGGEIRDVCPVHQGDGPNLAIGANGEWYCHSHGCKGGNLISLYQHSRKIDFFTAVHELADHFGIPVREDKNIESDESLQKQSHDDDSMDAKLDASKMIAAETWMKMAVVGQHPYFERKGIIAPLGIRYGNDVYGNWSAVIPFYTANPRTIQTLQYINDSGKYFLKGTTASGAFFSIGSISVPIAYFCEGLATACSIWESENKTITTISCGSSHNIAKVIGAIKEQHPNMHAIVCLDDDHTADATIKAVAALGVGGISFRKPDFAAFERQKDEKGKFLDKDFNDLHQLAGPEAVQTQLQREWKRPAQEKNEPADKMDLRFISEISPNYFVIQPPEKPRLLSFLDDSGHRVPFMHKGITAMLVGAGGTGKSHLLTPLAMSVTAGVPWLGKIDVDQQGSVCLIMGEMSPEDIHRLLWKTRKHLEKMLHENENARDDKRFAFSPNQLDPIDARLCPVSVHGISAGLIGADGVTTPFYENLLSQLKEKEPTDGWQLIVLDPASRFAGPDAEKDNAVATAFIASLERISAELKGEPTILLSHHKSKVAIRDGKESQADARGSSGITDGVRWQANIDKIDNDCSKFYITKTNFTAYPKPIKISKGKDGIPIFIDWMDPKEKKNANDDEEPKGKDPWLIR